MNRSVLLKGIIMLVFAVLFIEACHSPAASAQTPPAQEETTDHIILLSLPDFSFLELQPATLKRMPNLAKAMQQAQLASLNIRTPERGIEDVYLTINAGAPAVAPSDVQAFDRNELRGRNPGMQPIQQFTRYTGTVDNLSQIVIPKIGYLHNLNERQYYRARLGLLGDQLALNHIAVSVYGNGDTEARTLNRYAPLLLMSGNGTIPAGHISTDANSPNPNSPYGMQLNTSLVINGINNTLTNQQKSVTLIEYNDWVRLNSERQSYHKDQYEMMRRTQLQLLDAFISELAQITEQANATELWIFSPKSSTQANTAKLYVTPFIIIGNDGQPGLLTSPTTKRTGIISLHDLGPSILQRLGISTNNEWTGFPMANEPATNGLAALLTDVSAMQNVYKLRTLMVIPFVSYEVLILLVCLLAAIKKWPNGYWWMRAPLFSILVAPLLMVLLGFFSHMSIAAQLIIFLLSLVVCSVGASCLQAQFGLAIIAGLTSAVILVDGWLGAPLMKHSIMGYDPMIGARYYGIGNELMGVLVGGTILFFAVTCRAPFRRYQAVIAGMWFLIIIFYMAAPFAGTNAGGALTAAVGFGIAWIRMYGKRSLKQMNLVRLGFIAVAALLVGLSVLLALNLVQGEAAQQSHIGRAANFLLSGRFDIIADLIRRKLEMNIHLIGVSSWSKVLLTSLFVLVVLFLRPRGVFRRWFDERPVLMSGFTAILIGAIVALVFNDSGIVAAGTMIVFVAAPILLLILHNHANDNHAEDCRPSGT